MKNFNKKLLIALIALILTGFYSQSNAQLVTPPTNLLPIAGATNTSLTPDLEWSHPLAGLATFRVQVASDNGFAPGSIVLDQGGINGNTLYTVPANILDPNTEYHWRVNATVLIGISLVTSNFSSSTSFTTAMLTGLTQNGSAVPDEYKLHKNYPNPFNPTTNINFDVKEGGFVNLRVYNMLGQEVAKLVSQDLNAGRYQTTFDASGLSSGIYIANYSINDFNSSLKLILNK